MNLRHLPGDNKVHLNKVVEHFLIYFLERVELENDVRTPSRGALGVLQI